MNDTRHGACQICDSDTVELMPLHQGDPSTLWVCLKCANCEWAEPGDGLTADGEPRIAKRDVGELDVSQLWYEEPDEP